MKSRFIKIFTLFIYVLFVVSSSARAIPNEYLPNYNINSNWQSILEILTRIEAYRKTWTEIPAQVFGGLYTQFRSVWSYLPQDPTYKVVYEQCDITTNNLSKWFTYDKFSTFLDQCYDPITKITSEVNSKYTVVPSIKASPNSWPAPLNVTFDGRWSTDPSNDTIPADNFFWYYKDMQWVTRVIWKWPVVNHTFSEAWNYVIHSTVRSVNNNKWILDWQQFINVNVSPQSANIVVFANGKKMNENSYIKIWTTEAKNWVSFDGTATTPNWWRKIMSHIREISSSDWYKNQYAWQWTPSVANFTLPWNGIYSVKLTTADNENNYISKSFELVVSDPVAIIKSSPELWTTSTNFSFDAGNSYSISSKIQLYKWEIYDMDGNLIDTIQSKQINKQFIRPWTYTIKLTVYDEFWKNNIEQIKLIVESTSPIAQYSFIPTQTWTNPSQYIMNANSSFDVDVSNGFDKLSYQRKVSSNNAKIEQIYDDGKRALITFNEKWSYKVTLAITDSFGKTSEVVKDFNILSTVRPMIIANPGATTRWKTINFNTNSNKNIVSYSWNFGDWGSKITTDSSVSHSYKSAWIYIVKLYVTTSSLEENTVQIPVFIWEINKPIAVYDVLNPYQQNLIADQICTSSDGDHPAYAVDRYDQMEINASNSLDIKWQKNNLNVYYKPQNDNIFQWSSLKYKFSEVGCQYVDMIVEDKNESKIDKKRMYFKVKNALPTINNVVISFPQYTNDVWIWFNQDATSQDASFVQFDPLAVKVMADTPVDKDGQISYFTWYYYKTDDPSRLLDIKITPWNINWVIFNISRESGEYTFWVKITDNDGWERTSEEIIWKWPVVFIKPKWWSSSNDIPIVTLKVDNTIAKVWENITFTVDSKILSDKSDFKANRVFKYDFDGDGIYDLTTKDATVKYAYTKASPDNKSYNPKVKVIYKEKAGEAFAESITVRKWLKPQLDYTIIDKTIFISDNTIWVTENTKIEYCMDLKNCNQSGYIYNISSWDKKFLKFTYPSYWKYIIKISAKDDFGNEETIREIVTIVESESSNYVDIISFPKISKTDEWEAISVWKNMNNTLFVNVLNNYSWACSISVYDGNTTNPYSCNEDLSIKFDDDLENWYINIKYETDKGEVSRQIKVILIDNQYVVPEKYIPTAQKIDEIRKWLIGNTEYKTLDSQLSELRKSLWDRVSMNDIIPSIKDTIKGISWANFTWIQDINALIDWVSDKSTVSIMGANEYEQAKSDILAVSSADIKDQIAKMFDNIDSANWDKDNIYTQMTWILVLVKSEVDKWNMDPTDYESIKAQICSIALYKEIPTSSCDNPNVKPIPTESDTWTIVKVPDSTSTPSSSSIAKTMIKVVLYIVWFVILLFVWWVIYYAIKKRKEQSQDQPTA